MSQRSGLHTNQLFQFGITRSELISDGTNEPVLIAKVFPTGIEAFGPIQFLRIAVINTITIKMYQRVVRFRDGEGKAYCTVSIIKKGDIFHFT
ncbi:hypothetical protein HA51_22400 [Pantoea rwandensis]|uniref:Uncharacterized protein n=1 Tax=Pantoea rwandensis TaxID=1076550 RepID=A0A1X1CR07_9GAMM|nr:hypothetical protein HA51_22400 [Pantoea rwandensis]